MDKENQKPVAKIRSVLKVRKSFI